MTDTVLRAFADQARFCSQLGSPFTAQVCAAFATRLTDATRVGRQLMHWPGDPSAKADSLPLRVTGALHALARSGRHPELTQCYPPNPTPEVERLWSVIERCLDTQSVHFDQYLRHAPQTNEVGRSALLMAGLLEVAAQTRTPVRLFEIGASAGLNLILDRYRYRFGAAHWGEREARLCLQPAWTGDSPPTEERLQVIERHGVDLNPLDLGATGERERLLSYVWADQTERMQRIEAAIATALQDLPHIERMDAADWLEQRMDPRGQTGTTQVLMHSIVWNYLDPTTRARIEEHMRACAAHAAASRPLAWVRFELDQNADGALLQATVWPQNRTVTLARAHPHGSSVVYLDHL